MPCCTNVIAMTRNLFFLSLLLLPTRILAQDTIAFAIDTTYGFINPEVNEVHNSVSLAPFFEKLYQVKKHNKTIVNILQVGDSHMQADFLSGATRRLIQREFGNAGRGLVFPGRVGRTNESASVYSSSSATWEAKRIIYTNQPLPIGVGAMTLQTKQEGASLSLKTKSSDGLNYAFNKVTFFFQKDFDSYNLVVKDSLGNYLAYAGPYTFESKNTSRILLPFATHHIEFQTLKSTASQNQFVLFGINLENSKPGVIYHATGGNGAKVKHYLEAAYFAEQTKELIPDLIIISLGTNEAIEYPYVDPGFKDQLNTFLQQLKDNNPNAQFLLTTVMDFYKKKTRRNPGVEVLRDQLLEYATENNLAYWDLYTSAGGKHAADEWKKNNLIQPDGIHFTKAGYELQGRLLYEALIKGYNEYVLYRYP
jgi:lysophospholipase L1-like esterase